MVMVIVIIIVIVIATNRTAVWGPSAGSWPRGVITPRMVASSRSSSSSFRTIVVSLPPNRPPRVARATVGGRLLPCHHSTSSSSNIEEEERDFPLPPAGGIDPPLFHHLPPPSTHPSRLSRMGMAHMAHTEGKEVEADTGEARSSHHKGKVPTVRALKISCTKLSSSSSSLSDEPYTALDNHQSSSLSLLPLPLTPSQTLPTLTLSPRKAPSYDVVIH
jgi:hypothetical protein